MSLLRHELRGALSPALMVSDRLLRSEDPLIRRAGDAVVRSVERATALIGSDRAASSGRQPGSLLPLGELDVAVNVHRHQQPGKPNITVSIADPPCDTSGNGTPPTGMAPITMAMLTKQYMKKLAVMPNASNRPN